MSLYPPWDTHVITQKPLSKKPAYGWACPVCGRGVAPTEKMCEHRPAMGQQPEAPTDGVSDKCAAGPKQREYDPWAAE